MKRYFPAIGMILATIAAIVAIAETMQDPAAWILAALGLGGLLTLGLALIGRMNGFE